MELGGVDACRRAPHRPAFRRDRNRRAAGRRCRGASFRDRSSRSLRKRLSGAVFRSALTAEHAEAGSSLRPSAPEELFWGPLRHRWGENSCRRGQQAPPPRPCNPQCGHRCRLSRNRWFESSPLQRRESANFRFLRGATALRLEASQPRTVRAAHLQLLG